MDIGIPYLLHAVVIILVLVAAFFALAARQGSRPDEKIKNDKTNGGSISLASYTKYAKKIPPKLIAWWFILVSVTVLINIRVVHKDPVSLMGIIIVLTLIMYFFYWLIIGPTGRWIRDSQIPWALASGVFVLALVYLFLKYVFWWE